MSHSMDRETPGVPPVSVPEPAVGAPRVILIAAVASNGVIGAQGGMPWRLPEDLRHFKALTLGHPVIMGRRTWDSLGRALPGRENVVITRRSAFDAPGARVVGSLDEALASCAEHEKVFVIGGGEIYAEALGRADEILLTEIDAPFQGDTRFPDVDRGTWRELSRENRSPEAGPAFAFVRYERRRPIS